MLLIIKFSTHHLLNHHSLWYTQSLNHYPEQKLSIQFEEPGWCLPVMHLRREYFRRWLASSCLHAAIFFVIRLGIVWEIIMKTSGAN